MLTRGTRINRRYEIIRLVGQGGMGAVYEAIDSRLGHHVALKQTLTTDPQYARAFEREAQLLAHLQHPGLPRVTDYFSDHDNQFLVMDFIPGDDLAMMLYARTSAFPFSEALAWGNQLLDILGYLHTQTPPILHRDIKPQNLKVSPQGSLILLDFGLAKGAIGRSQPIQVTSTMGYTPQYAPIEQIHGSGTDVRSDLYSVGATLYHLLVGTPPPSALERAALLMQHEPDPLLAPHMRNPTITPNVSHLIVQAMSLDPAARPTSAATLQRALQTGTLPATVTAQGAAALPTNIPTVIRQALPSTREPISNATPKAVPAAQPGAGTNQSMMFLVYWLLTNTVGLSLGRAVGWIIASSIYQSTPFSLGDNITLFPAGLSLAIDTSCLGIILTLSQFLTFRRHFTVNHWWMTGPVAVWVVIGPFARIMGGLLGGALIGLLIGIIQWFLLREYIHDAWRWVLISILGYALLLHFSGVFNGLFFENLGGSFERVIYERGTGWLIAITLANALVGALFGLLTGSVLAPLLRHKHKQ